MRYPDGGGLTAQGRSRREKVRLEAVEMFAQDADVRQIARSLRGARLRIECAGEKAALIGMRHWPEQERAGDARYGADLHEPALVPPRVPFRLAMDLTCI